jgi:hypothetical protein
VGRTSEERIHRKALHGNLNRMNSNFQKKNPKLNGKGNKGKAIPVTGRGGP